MKVGWVLFVILQLVLDVISRIIEGMDFVNPDGFLIEGVESQGKPYNETQNKGKDFFPPYFIHSSGLILRYSVQ